MRPKLCALLVLLSLFAVACGPVGSGAQLGGGGFPQGQGVPSNPPSRVGILEVSGPQVFVNGTSAQSGEAISNENRVTTGAGSSGLIDLDTGGSLQLDENTDPLFRFQLLKEGWCLVVNIASGQIFDDTHSGGCVEINTPDGSGVVASSVNVHVGKFGFDLDGAGRRGSIDAPSWDCRSAARERDGEKGTDRQYASTVIG